MCSAGALKCSRCQGMEACGSTGTAFLCLGLCLCTRSHTHTPPSFCVHGSVMPNPSSHSQLGPMHGASGCDLHGHPSGGLSVPKLAVHGPRPVLQPQVQATGGGCSGTRSVRPPFESRTSLPHKHTHIQAHTRTYTHARTSPWGGLSISSWSCPHTKVLLTCCFAVSFGCQDAIELTSVPVAPPVSVQLDNMKAMASLDKGAKSNGPPPACCEPARFTLLLTTHAHTALSLYLMHFPTPPMWASCSALPLPIMHPSQQSLFERWRVDRAGHWALGSGNGLGVAPAHCMQ